MEPIIKLTNITASYDNNIVVSDANLTIYDHDYLGVIGPNGGGKTTLMKILLGLKSPKSGMVEYFRNGEKVDEITMGYLPQYNAIDRRVLLARAIVSRPDVIILDEPNTYIDRHFQEQMYEMLANINKQCAIVIVSHDITEILQNVKHIACVNHKLHYHETADLPKDKLEEHFLKMY